MGKILYGNNNKQLWSIVNEIFACSKTNVAPILEPDFNEQKHVNSKDICNSLNTYYVNIVDDLVKDLSPPDCEIPLSGPSNSLFL